ncbi:MAG: DNA-processing protein DprA [Pseudomonadota bacterium]
MCTDGLGSIRLTRLLSRFGSALGAVRASACAWTELGIPATTASRARAVDRATVARVDRQLTALGVSLVAFSDAAYPRALRHVHDSPAILLVQGHVGCLQDPCVAVVGARRSSAAGRALATDIARELAGHGRAVVSGLARGIDGAAHRGALSAPGATIAVVASGQDRVYPSQHRELAGEIVRSGAVVSEYLPGVAPRPGHFPQRNRIIAGLCSAVIVVEADLRSGSLITARLALDAGRDVFAVPGSVGYSGSRGCNAMLRDGARLVRDSQDVLDDLRLGGCDVRKPVVPAFVPAVANSPDTARIASELSASPMNVDEISAVLDLPAATVLQALQWLQISGFAEPIAGGNWTLTTNLPIAFANL